MNLRQQCRQKRQQLSREQQFTHAQKATRLLLRSRWLQRPKRIAVFLAQDGELGTDILINSLWQRGHQVYLPVLQTLRGRHMAFATYCPNSQMHANQFGILEPKTPHQFHLTGQQIDLAIMPLACFDSNGNRMGMGGGFYDRTFQFKRKHPQLRPYLIGWAHECQKIAALTPEKWDIPMDGLISEQQVYTFNKPIK